MRRNLILEANLSNKVDSLGNLDELDELITFLPITEAALRTAAQLWASQIKWNANSRQSNLRC